MRFYPNTILWFPVLYSAILLLNTNLIMVINWNICISVFFQVVSFFSLWGKSKKFGSFALNNSYM